MVHNARERKTLSAISRQELYSESFISGDMKRTKSEKLNVGDIAYFTHSSPDKSTGNEDSIGFCELGNDTLALVVADGLGGYRAGGKASKTAVKTFFKALRNHDPEKRLRSTVLNGLERANRKVVKVGGGAATTFIGAVITGNRVRVYHMGDSGAVLVGQRGVEKIRTIAHSPVGLAEASGLIDEEEALAHENRHLVSNVLGSTEMRIEIGPPIDIARYDTLLLASDGLFDNLRMAEIVELIRKGRVAKVANAMKDCIGERMNNVSPGQPCKPDDLSFIIFRRDR